MGINYFQTRRFPGATKSPLVTTMDFITPSKLPTISTYRVMSDDGSLEDPTREEPDVTDEQILTWYKNMLTGTYPELVKTTGMEDNLT